MNNQSRQDFQQPFAEATPQDELRALQVVRAGSANYGIFADEIATVVPWREPTRLPHAPKSVLGVVSIQGRMLTVLELAVLTDGEAVSSEAASENDRRVIALRGDEQLALAVTEAGAIVNIAMTEIKPRQENSSPLVLGSWELDGVEINILNLCDLFSLAIQGRQRRRRSF